MLTLKAHYQKTATVLLLFSFALAPFSSLPLNKVHAQSPALERYEENQVIVKYRESRIDLEERDALTRARLDLIEDDLDKKIEFKEINTAVYESDDTTTQELIDKLEDNPSVQHVEPNLKVWIDGVDTNEPEDPNDNYFDLQYALDNDGQSSGTIGADIQAKDGWEIVEATGSGTEMLIGVVDTGIDYTHSDLRENLWYNPEELALADTNGNNDGEVTYSEVIDMLSDFNSDGTVDLKDLFISNVSNLLMNSIDEDINGYVDDFIGWDVYNNDNNPMDDHSHGTHVAGIIAASKNNSIGVAGINTDVKLVAVKSFNSSGSSNFSIISNSISYTDSIGVKILNNSFGTTEYKVSIITSLKDKMEDSGDNNGTLFIVAAGNGNDITESPIGFDIDSDPTYTVYPAAFDLDNIITVASTDRNDSKSSFSNYGQTSVDIAAPGSSIYATYLSNSYIYKSGTSMATPMVVGAASYLYKYLEYLNGTTPTYTELKAQILDHTEYVPGLDGYLSQNNDGVRGKRLNLFNILPPDVDYEFTQDPNDSTSVVLNVIGNKAGTLTIASNPALSSKTHSVAVSGTGSSTLNIEYTDESRNTFQTDAELLSTDRDWIESLTIDDTHSSTISRSNDDSFALSGTCYDNNSFNLKIETDGDAPPSNTLDIENISCVSGIWSTILDLSTLANGEVTFKPYKPDNSTITGESEIITKNVTTSSGGGGGGGGTGTPITTTTAPAFPDIDGNTFESYIEDLFEAGVVSGYSDGNFKPDELVTREQMAKFIVKAFGFTLPQSNTANFPDITADSKFYTEILILKNSGIVNGYSDGTYRPSSPVTRGEVTKFVVLALNAKGINTSTQYADKYPDVTQSNLFVNYINYLSNQIVNNETIISGFADGTFRPNDYLTRGQMSKIIWNSMEFSQQ